MSLDLDALHLELASCDQIHLVASTLGAFKFSAIGFKRIPAVITIETCPNPLKVERGPFCDGTFADDVPIKLYRFAYDGREVADDQVDASDPLGITRMTECDLKDVLRDGEFVHFRSHLESVGILGSLATRSTGLLYRTLNLYPMDICETSRLTRSSFYL